MALAGPKHTYDVLIVGGGHNGLVAAGYLAKAGHRVCLLERHTEVGGAAFTQEIAPGFHLSEGSYVLSLMPRKILDELEVAADVHLIRRDPRFFMPFPDGRSLTAWEDHPRFIAEIARFSAKDARNYPRYDAFVERAAQIYDRYLLRQPPSFAEFAADFTSTTDDARVFQRMILGSAADVAEYFFESEQMQAVACAFGIVGTFRGPRDAGTAFVKLFHSTGMVTGKRGQWAYVRGAMGAVSQALERRALALGVEIRTGCEVDRICTAGGRATGAVTASGEEFHAPVVLSNADPVRTYLGLVERDALPEDFVEDVEAIQITSPVMKINLALDELPRYTAAADDPRRAHTGGVFIAPSIDDMQRAYEQARAGRPSDRPIYSVHTQSAVDPTVAPPGKATLSLFTQYFPYDLAEGTWDERREAIADAAIERFAEYAPNIRDTVVARQVLAPPDIEARFGLTGGHIFQGEVVPEQMFDLRPVPGSREYEGPIHGLYLCGAGAWPGGCVSGAPGHNAAHEAIEKLAAGAYR